MSLNKSLRVGYGLARVGFGIFASSRPTQMGRTWVGEDAESPGSEVILRALGFRDIVLQPEAVRIHQEADDLGPLCVVRLDYRQRLSIGPLEATIPVQGVVRRRVLGPRPQRTSPGLERLVE